MKSEEIALRAGRLDEPHITQAQREARDYVVSNGRLTGHEYGVALHDSAVIQRFTSNHQNGIAIPDFSGYPLNSVEVHHNHPVGDSFSASDIKLLLHRSDVGRIFVHGHNGFFAEAFTQAAPLTQDAAALLVQSAKSRAQTLLAHAVQAGAVSYVQANAGLWPVVMAAVLEGQGHIGYAVNSGPLRDLVKKVVRHG
jgi:hypothetical protein